MKRIHSVHEQHLDESYNDKPFRNFLRGNNVLYNYITKYNNKYKL